MKRNVYNMVTAFTIHKKLLARGIERRMSELQRKANDIKKMSEIIPDDIDTSDDMFKTFENEMDEFINDAKTAFDYKDLVDLGYKSHKEDKANGNEIV